MFYLRINRVKILNNREMLGKAEIQFMSFATRGESDFPELKDFFTTNDEAEKKELVKGAIEKVVSSRIMMPIQRFKDNQEVYFGDTGYIVYQSDKIPTDLNWMFLAIELDSDTRSNAELVSSILTNENINTVMGSFETLAGMSNPVSGAISKLATFVGQTVTDIFKSNRDDQAGLFLASFIRDAHYPHGTRDKVNIPDLTSNMFLDYTIFGHDE